MVKTVWICSSKSNKNIVTLQKKKQDLVSFFFFLTYSQVTMAQQWSGGHSSSILCIGASPGPSALLASGSEGGEVTVWNQDGTIVGRLTLPGEDDSTSVAFSPVAPGHLFVSHGDKVSVVDPRNLKGPVEAFEGAGEEEINALALSETGSALALADDSGAVRVLELPTGKVCRTLRRHTNICSSVAFRPHRPNNLLSAGLDMQVKTSLMLLLLF